MNRRNALLSVAGAGLTGTYATAAAPRRQVIARDGTFLFHRDWGMASQWCSWPGGP